MRRQRKSMIWVLCILARFSLLIAPSLAFCQTADPNGLDQNASRDEEPAAGVRVVERAPRMIYAEDEQGNRVPLINARFDEIQRLLNGDAGNGQRRLPQYQLDRVQITGRADTGRATLDLDVEITTFAESAQDQESWVSVPLRMHESSLLETPQHEGDGQLYLTHDPTDGYQAWIRHKSTGKHRIRLRFSTNLSRAALATQIRFFPPTANISRLELDVPGEPITADIENGRDLKVLASAESRSTITASDLRNRVIVVWRDGVEVRDQKAAYLDARGDVQVSIDGPGAIRSDIVLDVKSYSDNIESFALRLPPYTTIVSKSEQGYQISELNRPIPADGDNRRTVQVTLDKPGPQIQLQFTTQTTGESTAEGNASGLTNVANFEVIGALRQSGRVTLMSSEDWLVYWYVGPSVRRIQGAEDPSETEDRKRLATFEYFRQPCRLDVEIKPQSTRISVEPTYRMKVEEDRVALEVILRYKIRGARVSFLDFALNGWQLDDVGPSTTVENDHFQDSSESSVKLRLTQPRTGELELILNLHRPVTESAGTLRFPLPWPSVDSINPGILIVTAVGAVVLDYRLEEMVGLAQESVPPEYITARTLTPIPPTAAFRFRTDRAPGDVVIDYEIRDQEITVRTDTVMEVSAKSVDVTQRFTYKVMYQPASRLNITLPRALSELVLNPRLRSDVELQVDGQMLTVDDLVGTGSELSNDESTISWGVPLAQPRLGTIDLQLSFPWRINSDPGNRFTFVPLATPADGQLLGNTARLNPLGPMQVELAADSDWDRDDDSMTTDSLPGLALTSDLRTSSIPLRATKLPEDTDEESTPGATVVHRAWMQSWLASRSRLDRAVFQIASGSDRVYLQLPENEDIQSITLIVDGVENRPVFDDQDLEIRVARRAGGEHTIEVALRYNTRPSAGAIHFKIPRFRDALPARRWFWQLLLPDHEHLLLTDPRLASANRWERRGWLWHRTGSMTQPWLENWTGASRQPQLPESLNQYLFSSFDRIDVINIRTCQRRWLVYASSAVVLTFGLALIYLPVLRHPMILLVLALALVAGAWLFPSASILLAQASLLGSLLVVLSLFVTGMMRWLSARQSHVESAVRQGDSRSDIRISWRESNGNSTTTAVPVQSLPAIVPDSKA